VESTVEQSVGSTNHRANPRQFQNRETVGPTQEQFQNTEKVGPRPVCNVPPALFAARVLTEFDDPHLSVEARLPRVVSVCLRLSIRGPLNRTLHA
jgi:hypothetical protein